MPPVDTVRLTPEGRELSALLPRAGRHLIGICGAPGAGKSHLADHLARTYGVVVLPMDGFHLADAELARRGILDRKGAPGSFDGWGYAALLGRLAARPDHVVMAPAFERELEQPLAGSIPIPPDAGVVVTEGSYLLLDEDPWRAVRARLDAVWYVSTADPVRLPRLVARHERFGKSPEQARAWVEQVDQPNALLVEAARERADLVLDLTRWRG
jgi:pantothenate kinase